MSSVRPESEAAGDAGVRVGAPGRGRVFVELWWRSLVVAVAGGAAIGAAYGLGVTLAGVFGGDRTLPVIAIATVLGAVFGATAGFLLWIPAGTLIGLAGALWTVPYPGHDAMARTLRRASVAAVAVCLPLVLRGISDGEMGNVDMAVFVAPGLASAWVCAPWIGKWYARRMGDQPPR